MAALVESMAYRLEGGLPWHGLGQPVANNMSVDEMLDASGTNWTVSKRPLYFPKIVPEGAPTSLRIAPEEYALVRDSDERLLDTVGSNFKPVQNRDIFDFFKRFVEAGDMEMETAGSLKGGRFVWALARISDSFKIGKADSVNGYLLLSQPHQFGFSLTAALTPVRVVCNNTLNYAVGSQRDGSEGGRNTAHFRMVHSRLFDADAKAEAERALGLAHEGMKAFSHTAELLSGVAAKDAELTDYFHNVLQLEQDEEEQDPEKDEKENRNVRRFREAFLSSPGAELNTAKGNWWGAFNAVTYTVDHKMGLTDDNRLYSAWYGRGSATKRRALDLAVEYAKVA
jgi:phage/plasmid-like protein (TIGR03299 family)